MPGVLAVLRLITSFTLTPAQWADPRAEIAKLDERSSRLPDAALGLKSRAAVLRKVDTLEDQRSAIEQRIVAWE
jgi:hypothetical protein